MAFDTRSDMRDLIRTPFAWLPFLLSLAAFALVAGYVVLVGLDQPAPTDEGTPAHLFQLLMVADAIVIAIFVVRWLPRAPKETALIVALQLCVALIPFAALAIMEASQR